MPTLISSTAITMVFTLLTWTLMKMTQLKNTTHNKTKTTLKKTTLISLLPLTLFLNNKTELTLKLPSSIPLMTTNIEATVTLDLYSMLFMPVALFITWSIVEFSTWYMNTDPNMNKFIMYLLTFLTSMLVIITANNLYQLFMGWEGVGIMSFLLIGWWRARTNANTAALQAIIYNRIGDIGFILMLAWSLTSASLNVQDTLLHPKTTLLPLMGLLVAAMSKSAQLGLHPWLPAAMEGPTPVSALLHSSTMVVAGVFLLIRLHPLIQNDEVALSLCLVIGAMTSLFAAASACTQNDIKKIVALSTTSQLGLMMTAIGLNQPTMAFIHMTLHSFFKALLFLCSGLIIHTMEDEQDIRKMGSTQNSMPTTSSAMTTANLALIGTPFLSGFYSKDTIIETINNSNTNAWALAMTLMATTLSATYTLRMMSKVQMNFTRKAKTQHQEPTQPLNPITKLTAGTILAGMGTKTVLILHPPTMTMPLSTKITALLVTLAGALSTLDLMSLKTHMKKYKSPKHQRLLHQITYHEIAHRYIPTQTLKQSQNSTTELADLWMLEKWGPKGLAEKNIHMIHLTTQQKNQMKMYLTVFILSATLATLSAYASQDVN